MNGKLLQPRWPIGSCADASLALAVIAVVWLRRHALHSRCIIRWSIPFSLHIKNSMSTASSEKSRFEALSEFRFRLRSFLRFSEDAARKQGITVLQYQLILHTQGFPDRSWATIGELAERLQAQPHGVVALVSRCEEAGLVRRQTSTSDRRQVEVHLLPAGRRKLARLAVQHAGELAQLAEAVRFASIIEE